MKRRDALLLLLLSFALTAGSCEFDLSVDNSIRDGEGNPHAQNANGLTVNVATDNTERTDLGAFTGSARGRRAVVQAALSASVLRTSAPAASTPRQASEVLTFPDALAVSPLDAPVERRDSLASIAVPEPRAHFLFALGLTLAVATLTSPRRR